MKQLLKYFSVVIFLMFFITCKKQVKVSETITNFGTIYGVGGAQTLCGVVETKDKGYVLYGYTNSSGNGSIDGFVMKVDEQLKLKWYKNYGGKWIDKINGLAIDDEGNMLAVGLSNSFGVSVDTSVRKYNDLFYLVYMNVDGEIIWDTTFQANGKEPNNSNAANSVLFLENKTFAVVGTTLNFYFKDGGNIWWTYDGYVFGINKSKTILWKTQVFKTPVSPDPYLRDERMPVATLTEKGDIIAQMTTEIYNPGDHNYFMSLAKLSKNGTPNTVNGSVWKSKDLYCLGTNEATPMNWNDTGGVVFYNYLNNSLDFTNPVGSVYKSFQLNRQLYISSIERMDNQFLLTSGRAAKNNIGSIPGWLVVNNQGKIVEEHYITSAGLKDNLELKKVLKNSNNEMIVFGLLHRASGTDIVILKYDQNGEIIK